MSDTGKPTSDAGKLWKATARAVLIGLAGTAAMLATETMLFPGLGSEEAPAPACVATSCNEAAAPEPAS